MTEVAALDDLGLEELRGLWRETFGVPPKLRSPRLLRHLLAYRLQAREHGSLTSETKSLLLRGPKKVTAGLELGEGAVIRKTYRGRTYEVEVEVHGFRFEGEHFPSLSPIATKISGCRRNGPQFFGLRKEP